MRATAPKMMRKGDMVFELFVDSDAKRTAVKKALKARKMSAQLKAFTTTGNTINHKIP